MVISMICTRCKKRPAVVFITRMDGDKSVNDGLCLVCAKELGIKPVDELLEKFGITEEDMEQMEEQLGTELLERTYRGVKLTAAGERFLTHAKDILRHVDVALEDVCEAISVPTGRVALGLPQSMAKYLGVPLVREVLQRWPKIQLQIIEMNTGYVPDHLGPDVWYFPGRTGIRAG